MRRIWAHIIIALTTFILAVVSFTAITNNLNVGLEYAGGRVLTFQLTEKTYNADDDYIKPLTEESAEEVAEGMKVRLDRFEVDRYDIDISGDDIIKVTLSQPKVDYTQIIQLLSFNGTLTLNSYANNTDYYASSEVFLNEDKPAYLVATDEIYPTINIPIDTENDDYKLVLENAIKGDPIIVSGSETEETEDDQYARFMYLVYNFIPGIDTYNSESFSDKILLNFPLTEDNNDPMNYYEEADGSYSLSAILSFEDGKKADEITAKEASSLWSSAYFYVNLLNAGSYEYDVTLIHVDSAESSVENLFKLDENQTVFSSGTFIAFACSILIVSLVLVIFYKLGALSVGTTTFIGTFLSILILAVFSSEFNMMAVVGLLLTGFASLASGILYLNKFKEEAYKGRSMKKANSEASKNSTLPIVDIHFVLIALGAMCYLIGGSIMRSFSLVTVVGGLISLILNISVLKGFMWLNTNASAANNKFSWFGVDQSKVPTLAKEEKQTYFGAYAKKDFAKQSKGVSIATLVGFIACLASMIVWGVVNKSVYNQPAKETTNEIYFKIDVDTAADLYSINDKIESVLDQVSLDPNGEKILSNDLYSNSPVLDEFNITEYLSAEGIYEKHPYASVVVELNVPYDSDVYYKGHTTKLNVLFDSDDDTAVITEGLEEVMEYECVGSKSYSEDQPNFVKIIIATAAALGISGLYLMLRYRLSKGLGIFATATAGATISAGLYSLLQFLEIGNYGVAGAVIGAFLSLAFAIIFANKEREMVIDDKKHDNGIENRALILKNSISYGFGDALNVCIVGLFLGICFFGFGPRAFTSTAVIFILSMALAFALAAFVLGPVGFWFYKKFFNISMNKTPKARKNKEITKKSAEPEEAVFIGIND